MKSKASSLIRLIWLFFASSFVSYAESVCPCANPPGGEIRCPDNHIAICRVIRGRVSAECIPIKTNFSQDFKTDEEAKAWILTKVVKRPVQAFEIGSPEYQKILRDKRFTNLETGETVTFRLPESLKKKLE